MSSEAIDFYSMNTACIYLFHDRKVGDKKFTIRKVSVNTAGESIDGEKMAPPKTCGETMSGASTEGIINERFFCSGITCWVEDERGEHVRVDDVGGEGLKWVT